MVPFFTHTWIFLLRSSWNPDQVVCKYTKENSKPKELLRNYPSEFGWRSSEIIRRVETWRDLWQQAGRGRQRTFHLLKCTSPRRLLHWIQNGPLSAPLLFHFILRAKLHFMIDTLHHRNDPKPSLIQCTGRPPPCCTSKTVKNAPSLLTSYFGKHRVKSICQILTT